MKKVFKWLLLGVAPWPIYLIIDGIITKDPHRFSDIIKAGIVFSPFTYFGLPYAYKTFKDLFIMWWEGNILVKIFIPLGMAGVIGRVLWMISLGH